MPSRSAGEPPVPCAPLSGAAGIVAASRKAATIVARMRTTSVTVVRQQDTRRRAAFSTRRSALAAPPDRAVIDDDAIRVDREFGGEAVCQAAIAEAAAAARVVLAHQRDGEIGNAD